MAKISFLMRSRKSVLEKGSSKASLFVMLFIMLSPQESLEKLKTFVRRYEASPYTNEELLILVGESASALNSPLVLWAAQSHEVANRELRFVATVLFYEGLLKECDEALKQAEALLSVVDLNKEHL